ncbi:unnamed protein product [Sphagnum balticum]
MMIFILECNAVFHRASWLLTFQSLRALLQGRNVLLSFETCKSSVRSDKSAVGKEDQDIEVVVYILES